MKALIQRVTQASVCVDKEVVGEIGKGILLLLGVEKEDTTVDVQRLVSRAMAYRIFPDEKGHMNLSLENIEGDLLVVSQFTLVASTRKGLRPSFSSAASPELAESLYLEFVDAASTLCSNVQKGVFGGDMKVSLINDGPVTFMLSSR